MRGSSGLNDLVLQQVGSKSIYFAGAVTDFRQLHQAQAGTESCWGNLTAEYAGDLRGEVAVSSVAGDRSRAVKRSGC